MTRVLDLGCGSGSDLRKWNVFGFSQIDGIDCDLKRLAEGMKKYPARNFTLGVAETLPYESGSFDLIVANVSLPYTDLPKSLAEARRVLVAGGRLYASLHSVAFTWGELWGKAFPKPLPMAYRLYVLVNGCYFHLTGKVFSFVNGRTESFQTERGMKKALKRAGFRGVIFYSKHNEWRVEAIAL